MHNKQPVREVLKSVLLVLLVLASLFQTYLLVYRPPQFDRIVPADYLQAETEGIRKTIEEVFKPRAIVVHFGEESHTVYHPESDPYNDTWNRWRAASFGGLEVSSLLNSDIEKLQQQRKGVTIQFKQSLSVESLQTILSFEVDQQNLTSQIDSMLLTMDEPELTVSLYLMTADKRTIYQVRTTDLSAVDVNQMLSATSEPVRYSLYRNQFFIPAQPLPLTQYELAFAQVSVEQLWQRLFIDPNITRNLIEKDGTKIYTDGKRGLQLKDRDRYLIYSDPVAQFENRSKLNEDLLLGVSFINQHGGWNGEYILHNMKQAPDGGEHVYEFRQYFRSLPMIDPVYSWYGYQRLKMKNGVVSGYQRPLIQLEREPLTQQTISLPGGQQLIDKLDQLTLQKPLKLLYPAYKADLLEGGKVRLQPVWAVEWVDGKLQLLQNDR